MDWILIFLVILLMSVLLPAYSNHHHHHHLTKTAMLGLVSSVYCSKKYPKEGNYMVIKSGGVLESDGADDSGSNQKQSFFGSTIYVQVEDGEKWHGRRAVWPITTLPLSSVHLVSGRTEPSGPHRKTEPADLGAPTWRTAGGGLLSPHVACRASGSHCWYRIGINLIHLGLGLTRPLEPVISASRNPTRRRRRSFIPWFTHQGLQGGHQARLLPWLGFVMSHQVRLEGSIQYPSNNGNKQSIVISKTVINIRFMHHCCK